MSSDNSPAPSAADPISSATPAAPRPWGLVASLLWYLIIFEGIARLFTQGMVLKGGEAMSKSKGNVVGAIDMAEKYGADTGRLYTLFAAPPEKDLEWSEESIEGAWRFLNRVYRLVEKHGEAISALQSPSVQTTSAPTTEKEKALLRKAHQTLRRVTQDFETRWHFNSAIAQIMELTNAIYAAEALQEGVRPEVQKEVLELVTLMLAPMTPHLSEELWEMLGHKEGLWTVPWPDFDPELARALPRLRRRTGDRVRRRPDGVIEFRRRGKALLSLPRHKDPPALAI